MPPFRDVITIAVLLLCHVHISVVSQSTENKLRSEITVIRGNRSETFICIDRRWDCDRLVADRTVCKYTWAKEVCGMSCNLCFDDVFGSEFLKDLGLNNELEMDENLIFDGTTGTTEQYTLTVPTEAPTLFINEGKTSIVPMIQGTTFTTVIYSTATPTTINTARTTIPFTKFSQTTRSATTRRAFTTQRVSKLSTAKSSIKPPQIEILKGVGSGVITPGRVTTAKGVRNEFKAKFPTVINKAKKIIVDYHNQVRRLVAKGLVANQPHASDMKVLTWDDDIAVVAQNWALKCNFEHRKKKVCGISKYHSLGENLSVRGGGKDFAEMNNAEFKKTIIESLTQMFEEHKDYTFSQVPGNCTNVCGHYTQMLWSKTEKVGCGISECPVIKGWLPSARLKSYLMVCNYGPGGNIWDDEPYLVGKACTKCPPDAPRCINGLCSSKNKQLNLGCQDTNDQRACNYFKNNGLCDVCTNYFNQMRTECPVTCGLCDYK